MGMNPDQSIDLAAHLPGAAPGFHMLRIYQDANAVRITLTPSPGEEGISVPQWALAAFKAAVAAL